MKLQDCKSALKKTSDDVLQALSALKNELHDQGIDLQIDRLLGKDPFIYHVLVPNTKVDPGSDNCLETVKVRLSLSGGQLMVKTGGGFQQFTEWLCNKKVIAQV